MLKFYKPSLRMELKKVDIEELVDELHRLEIGRDFRGKNDNSSKYPALDEMCYELEEELKS